VTFPESYPAKPELANKLATFEVEVTKIEAPQLPEIDEEFIQAYGIENGDIDAFYADIKANMENELKKALAAGLKQSVLEALYENIEFTIPKTLIDREIAAIIKPYEENAKKQNQDVDLPRDIFETEAKRRVGLGLILSEIIQVNKITVDNKRLRSTIKELALSYDSPDEVLQWYYQDENRLNDVKQAVLEEQTVEWLTGKMRITDELQSFSDSMTSYHQQQRG
jgi:trigger factor